ncbi:hypothetical protein KIN20_004276 [Parelaphostrongylus tenuis]|uniref:Uncharacterized protein n=1 Tax=Parelaphostrongylus tenuis TaxID=148309 RepID=A0AAD5MGS6_PARTN|nr:hypothetical protein KIN20_004276 [Parelaphostrongylus tenuis]
MSAEEIIIRWSNIKAMRRMCYRDATQQRACIAKKSHASQHGDPGVSGTLLIQVELLGVS